MSRTSKQRRDARKKRNRGAPTPPRNHIPVETPEVLVEAANPTPASGISHAVERNIEEDLRTMKRNTLRVDVEDFFREYFYDDWDLWPGPGVVIDPAVLEAVISDVLTRESVYLAHRDKNGAA
ncbi:hypothetical protein FK529_05135 [Tsukamurella asaccharolytica]|uniref:Uncharacterized protein n=1 Tax=Tsukamurella asaccharolytica TaxID=2592067 RepID=A0A5C5RDT6_9ACTN|nr:hypothetical protein [Tsukamurella asaccharolytica]TWS20724.1 hypothetical protein FK529_05135 [Tsukamurella asaccharolytica]